MLEKINEKVEVILISSLRPTPSARIYKIRWQGREYVVSKLGYHHSLRDGRVIHHIYSVVANGVCFRLNFDTENLLWVLEEVSDGLAS